MTTYVRLNIQQKQCMVNEWLNVWFVFINSAITFVEGCKNTINFACTFATK